MTKDPNDSRILANRYQLVELIGKGAMGQVYKAKDMLLGGVIVAVKFISQALLNQKMRLRFEREATICALLGEKSNHIVRVRDYGVDENEISFYVMEYLEGKNLSEIIRSQPLPLPRFLNIARQIGLGLQCAHKGIVIEGELSPIIHRDIKPSNILVIQDTSFGELVKILDFGIAKLLQSTSDQTHSFMGTLAYCSPEQMEGKELDKRSDIYSLGVMMFEMLTGEMPVVGETHSFGGWYKAHRFDSPRTFESANPNLKLPKILENLVMSCLAKEPADRPQSIEQLLQALEPLEQRFGKGRQLGQRIGEVLSKFPVVQDASTQHLPTTDELCLRTSWPKDKPKAAIVFPHIIRTNREVLATLWVMLTKEDIQKRQVSTRYNQFLFLTSPHPMLLWITALHNREHGARWLTCYLDLKTSLGQKVVRILGENGSYRILFFALSEPERCATVMSSTIAPMQRKLLIQWANAGQAAPSVSQPQLSKRLLKQEFEKLKPKILMKLEAIHTDYPTDISG
ncbi:MULTISPECIES: serine/threonine protein kinase [unclassified Coleofasciculus]|uniref:serine/threonine protein kinase n=1 Tax=unclassified Coleofasciculus TaxID=2692782 RepID=UPI00187F8144|nr:MULTISPECIES: serine/threonine-protein kinase [unclassified Coleofasciculus]MBE9128498.1 serine/threonine protein kinase [Coleofasciculus sp. LEGE 07081]MBE9148682.1 serine/threonine protein kinase [Coleofasciculus sp. LEGE 07092]